MVEYKKRNVVKISCIFLIILFYLYKNTHPMRRHLLLILAIMKQILQNIKKINTFNTYYYSLLVFVHSKRCQGKYQHLFTEVRKRKAMIQSTISQTSGDNE